MSTFDERWRNMARAARAAEPPLPEPPLHRVRSWMDRRAAAAVAGEGAGESGAGDLWFRYGTRGLATATVVLLASVWFALGGSVRDRESAPLRPGIENAVAEVFWLL